MKINAPNLFIEINNLEYIFVVSNNDENNDFNLLYKNSVSIQGISNNQIIDFELVISVINKNIYLIEKKLKCTFKEITIILDNFRYSVLNLAGYKKLNGSQILKENITYILNSLKATVNDSEKEKTILHIFNSKYYLDKKEINNLPIGLFGDFYSHELSFCLINNNDYKNLYNIFNRCNLKIKKIFLKSFIEGVKLSNENQKLETFFKININEKNSQVIYFENNALKFIQNFEFGTNLVLSDISKITSLNKDIIINILKNTKISSESTEQEFIDKIFLEKNSSRKIKKKLIYDIASARIQELSEILITKNINLTNYNKKDMTYFLKINDKLNLDCFKDAYKLFFSEKNRFLVKFIENFDIKDIVGNASDLVHFGWKKEAIPIIQHKKSLIGRFFDILFN
jgi:cell division protein FtsA